MDEITGADRARANAVVLMIVDTCMPFATMQDIIAQAIADERERCAKIADKYGDGQSVNSSCCSMTYMSGVEDARNGIASAIRNQGSE